MGTRTRVLLGTMVLPLLAFIGIVLLIAARAIGGMTPVTALLGGIGLALFLVVTVAGVTLSGDTAASEAA